MKNIIIFSLVLFSWSCTLDQKKETDGLKNQKETMMTASLNLSDTLLINKDFSIGYLKMDSLKYVDFNKKDHIIFKESKGGGLSCGNSDPRWSSFISLQNDAIGIVLEFDASWIENTEKMPEEVLSQISLKNAKAKFYNEIAIGKSNISETKIKFG